MSMSSHSPSFDLLSLPYFLASVQSDGFPRRLKHILFWRRLQSSDKKKKILYNLGFLSIIVQDWKSLLANTNLKTRGNVEPFTNWLINALRVLQEFKPLKPLIYSVSCHENPSNTGGKKNSQQAQCVWCHTGCVESPPIQPWHKPCCAKE